MTRTIEELCLQFTHCSQSTFHLYQCQIHKTMSKDNASWDAQPLQKVLPVLLL